MITDYALELDQLNFTIGRGKKAFSLHDISFSVPRGCVTGLIGENGAGKTTLMRLILTMYVAKGGGIRLFGTEAGRANSAARDKIGFVIDQRYLPVFHTAKTAGAFLANIYSNWNQDLYEHYLAEFKIPVSKRLFRLSSGTAQKVQIAAALSHGAELLILDEPFNFLDPVAKKRFLELLQEFMKDPCHAVLVSSHQTAELEKICDAVTFLHEGRVIFAKDMETITSQYGVLKIDESRFRGLSKKDYIGWRKTPYAYEVLTACKTAPQFADMVCEQASLENLMYFYLEQGVHDKIGGEK
ncbi:MAG: ABC transporter ATP-binding protein [Treponema sp.]